MAHEFNLVFLDLSTHTSGEGHTHARHTSTHAWACRTRERNQSLIQLTTRTCAGRRGDTLSRVLGKGHQKGDAKGKGGKGKGQCKGKGCKGKSKGGRKFCTTCYIKGLKTGKITMKDGTDHKFNNKRSAEDGKGEEDQFGFTDITKRQKTGNVKAFATREKEIRKEYEGGDEMAGPASAKPSVMERL